MEVSIDHLLAKIGELTITKELLEGQLAQSKARIAELERAAQGATDTAAAV